MEVPGYPGEPPIVVPADAFTHCEIVRRVSAEFEAMRASRTFVDGEDLAAATALLDAEKGPAR